MSVKIKDVLAKEFIFLSKGRGKPVRIDLRPLNNDARITLKEVLFTFFDDGNGDLEVSEQMLVLRTDIMNKCLKDKVLTNDEVNEMKNKLFFKKGNDADIKLKARINELIEELSNPKLTIEDKFEITGKIFEKGYKAVPQLLEVLNNDKERPGVRILAAIVLKRFSHPAALAFFKKTIMDEDIYVGLRYMMPKEIMEFFVALEENCLDDYKILAELLNNLWSRFSRNKESLKKPRLDKKVLQRKIEDDRIIINELAGLLAINSISNKNKSLIVPVLPIFLEILKNDDKKFPVDLRINIADALLFAELQNQKEVKEAFQSILNPSEKNIKLRSLAEKALGR